MTIYNLDVLLFAILIQWVVPCPVLTVASWPAYRFLKRQVRWSGIPISFRIFHSCSTTVKGFGVVNKAEIYVFLELSCFFDDSTDVGNLMSGSSAFSESSLNIWKFLVHILLKLSLKNFEHYFASVWNECSCEVVWTLFGIAFLWDWNKNWPFHFNTLKFSSFETPKLGTFGWEQEWSYSNMIDDYHLSSEIFTRYIYSIY